MSPVTQKVLFTALPRGRFLDGSLHVVAYVSPQLSTDDGADTTLAEYPDFLSWPSVPITWAVSIDGTVITDGIQVVSQPAPRADLWQALLPATTLVRSFQPSELTDRRVLSYPVAEITGLVRKAYRELLLDVGPATELPAVQDLIDVIGPASFFGRAGALKREELESELDAELTANRFNSPGDPNDPDTLPKAFAQHQRFLAPRSDGFGPQPVPVRDFHEYVAVLGHYRELVRLLGLAVDLKIPSDGIPLPPGPIRVQVQPAWTSALNPPDFLPRSTDVRPFTRTALTASTFLAAGRTTRTRVFGGRLALVDTDRYRLVEVDQDGAAVKVRQLAENLERGLSAATLDTPQRQALPALRSGGIAVAETGARGFPNKVPMAAELVTQIDKGAELNAVLHPSSGPIDEDQLELTAEDLTIGFRFDLWDSITSRWNSLTARTGLFNFFGAGVTIPSADQAILQPAPTSTTDPAAVSPDLFVQQTLFNWTGWSLGGHLPGLTIPHDADSDNVIAPPPAPMPDDFQLAFDFAPTPGSLPRLRFGATYYVRARAADLAGDSVAFGPPTPVAPGTPEFDQWLPAGPITYRRFEPVQTPPLLFGTANTEGESIENVVLRSNYNANPGDVIAGHPTRVAAVRYLAPPKVAVRMVDQHGLLDISADPPVDRELYRLLADRDPVMLPESDPVPISGELVVNYLPDPFARGVAFVGLPGVTGPLKVRFHVPGDWHTPRTFRLIMRQGSGPPQPIEDADGLGVVVLVPKAAVAKVKMSALIDEPDLDLLGLWGWLKNPLPGETPPPADDTALRQAATNGQIWMFTPWRVLTLVHAVRQPLLAPRFDPNFIWDRRFDDTFVTMEGLIRFDRKSTGAVDVHASWPNPVDAGPGATPPTLPGEIPPTAGNKTSIPLRHTGDKSDPKYVPVDQHHELGDTKHKVITYQVEGTTKFTEYFVLRTTTTTTGGPLRVLAYGPNFAQRFSGRAVVPGTVSVRSVDGSMAWPGTGDQPSWTVNLAAGTLWFNDIGESSVPVDTHVEVTYIDKPISRFGPMVTRNILASGRPAAPKIDRVVPTFGWTETRSTSQIVSQRPTAMLRVYMKRPWWTSGAGEKLGVVLLPGGVDGSEVAVPEHYLPFVTQFGRDPVYGTDALPDPLPRFTSFPEATSALRGLFLDELPHVAGSPDQLVDVSAHDVGFDAAQDLWYSDIGINAGSTYQPFVRLALARFQPDALAGPTDDRHLSRVVLADIMQLAPERTAVVVFDSDTQVTVTLHGPTYDSNDLGGASGSATIQLEKRRVLVPDPDVGWQPVGSLKAMTYLAPPGQARFWTRTINLPGPIVPGRYRLVIEQHDLFQHDSGTGSGGAIGNRLVHTDVIVL